ncbi:unnamed protein product [Leptosia nina]|uniref:ER-bound oxygenase mpaB/mpaB'/Rubber oxygenase catalytic domain-containing protein n=1 Tax=Leptosia nina TaxID=320188 RepID=A0AAV1IZK6_9NEOP
MDLHVDEVIKGLFNNEAYKKPSDKIKLEDLELRLPEWYDKKKFDQGRRFQRDFFYMQSIAMMLGLIAVMAIPTILKVLVSTRRSNSSFTAFKRYWSTFLHIQSWLGNELKPGSLSWRSLHEVRARHIMADRACKLKGHGTVSQRDVAFTIFGFIGFMILKPQKLGIRQLQSGDWEAFNHFWGVIGYMLGLEDRYNICRKNLDDTRQICRILQDRIYTPCLNNSPEYFEHAAHVMTVGMSAIHPAVEHDSLVFFTKYLADVPGYIYTEKDRIELQTKLKTHLNGNSIETGIDSSKLLEKCPIDFSPQTKPTVLYLRDYDTIEDSPQYKRLPFGAKFKLSLLEVLLAVYNTYIGRLLLNLHFACYIFIGEYLPYVAMWRYGVKDAYISLFKETPADDYVPKTNSEYYKRMPIPWYRELLSCVSWGYFE